MWCGGGIPPSQGRNLLVIIGRGRRQGVLILRARVVRLAADTLAARVTVPLCALPFLLMLHPAVLKPDFHLFLRQVQVGRDFDPPESRQVHVGGEFPLQLQELRAGERRPHPLAIGYLAGVRAPCRPAKRGQRGHSRMTCSHPTRHPLEGTPLKDPPAELNQTPVSIPHPFPFHGTSLLSTEGQRRPKQVKEGRCCARCKVRGLKEGSGLALSGRLPSSPAERQAGLAQNIETLQLASTTDCHTEVPTYPPQTLTQLASAFSALECEVPKAPILCKTRTPGSGRESTRLLGEVRS